MQLCLRHRLYVVFRMRPHPSTVTVTVWAPAAAANSAWTRALRWWHVIYLPINVCHLESLLQAHKDICI
jgi:hypothetical protein